MTRVFITGSADGLGRAAARTLLEGGHQAVVHVRNTQRLAVVHELVQQWGAEVVVGDLGDLDETRDLAAAGQMPPALLLAFTFALGAGVAVQQPAWGATMPELVLRSQLRAASSMDLISVNVSRAVGPALAGLVIAHLGGWPGRPGRTWPNGHANGTAWTVGAGGPIPERSACREIADQGEAVQEQL